MSQVRSEVVRTRLSQEEHEALRMMARANNTSVSDYIRTVVLDDPRLYAQDHRLMLSRSIDSLELELRREGNNVNQIEHRLNRMKARMSDEDMREARGELKRLFAVQKHVLQELKGLRLAR